MSLSVAPETILRPMKLEFHDVGDDEEGGGAVAAPEEEDAILRGGEFLSGNQRL